MPRRLRLLAMTVGALAWAGTAAAGEMAGEAAEATGEAAGSRFFVGLFGARWADSDLPDLPGKLFTGKLEVDDAWLAGLSFTWRVTPDIGLPWPGREPGRHGGRDGIALELEGQLIRHYGLQHHVETTLAVLLRTPDWRPFGGSGVNLAWGHGLSTTFNPPNYEKGVTGIRGVETRRLQYHMSVELEFAPGNARLRPFLRLHHRSGIYGVISPRETGSNYIGAGLRFALD